jgi:DNA-binding transcriptional ArsR family regulator
LSKTTTPKAVPSTLLSTHVIKALANDSRLEIMRWLKEPRSHFPPQAEGDLVKDGVCGLFIAQKLGVGPPTASEHLRVLVHAGLIRAKRIKQWTFYKRDEARIRQVKKEFRDAW